jgi:hypothetical protein
MSGRASLPVKGRNYRIDGGDTVLFQPENAPRTSQYCGANQRGPAHAAAVHIYVCDTSGTAKTKEQQRTHLFLSIRELGQVSIP